MAWKTSDITQAAVLDAVVKSQGPVGTPYPFELLSSTYPGAPDKVICAALWREERKGTVEPRSDIHGTVYLTPKGRQIYEALQ